MIQQSNNLQPGILFTVTVTNKVKEKGFKVKKYQFWFHTFTLSIIQTYKISSTLMLEQKKKQKLVAAPWQHYCRSSIIYETRKPNCKSRDVSVSWKQCLFVLVCYANSLSIHITFKILYIHGYEAGQIYYKVFMNMSPTLQCHSIVVDKQHTAKL